MGGVLKLYSLIFESIFIKIYELAVFSKDVEGSKKNSSSFIRREANVVLKDYKSPIRPHIEYCTRALTPASRHGN